MKIFEFAVFIVYIAHKRGRGRESLSETFKLFKKRFKFVTVKLLLKISIQNLSSFPQVLFKTSKGKSKQSIVSSVFQNLQKKIELIIRFVSFVALVFKDFTASSKRLFDRLNASDKKLLIKDNKVYLWARLISSVLRAFLPFEFQIHIATLFHANFIKTNKFESLLLVRP